MKILIVSPYFYEASIVDINEDELEDFVREYLGELFPGAFIRAASIKEIVKIIKAEDKKAYVEVLDGGMRVVIVECYSIETGRYDYAVVFNDFVRFYGVLLIKK